MKKYNVVFYSDALPFGTRADVHQEGYEWVNHSIYPTQIGDHFKRVIVGNKDCKKSYSASRLNISAMSYGAIGSAAILGIWLYYTYKKMYKHIHIWI